jgi:hypothetical protein
MTSVIKVDRRHCDIKEKRPIYFGLLRIGSSLSYGPRQLSTGAYLVMGRDSRSWRDWKLTVSGTLKAGFKQKLLLKYLVIF